MLGPVIQGKKVRLEPPSEAMLPIYIQWFADMTVTRYMHLRYPPSMKMEEEWFDRMSRSEHDIVWTIVADGRPIGSIGIHQIDWQNRHATTGIIIGERSEWGKGYASEAMQLRTRFAFEELGLEKVMTQVYAGNTASRRALEKAGYRQYGLARRHAWIGGEWQDAWLGELLRDEWLELQQDRS